MNIAARLILSAARCSRLRCADRAAVPAAAAGRRRAARSRSARRRAPTTGCSSCSRTATKPASSAIRCRPCSAATCATPTGSATCSATRISRARKRRPSRTSPRFTRSRAASSTPTDQLAYDVFEYPDQGHAARASAGPADADRSAADEPFLRHPHRISDASPAGRAARRSRRVEDYENSLKRNRDFAANIDEAIAPVAQGRGGGRGRHQADRPQHDRAARQPAQARSPRNRLIGGRSRHFPDSIGAADRARLTHGISRVAIADRSIRR